MSVEEAVGEARMEVSNYGLRCHPTTNTIPKPISRDCGQGGILLTMKMMKPEMKKGNNKGKPEGLQSLGPWGGASVGKQWTYMANGAITEVVVSHGLTVDGLRFKSAGSADYSESFSGTKGNTTKIVLNSDQEYLRGISGTYGNYEGKEGIRSLVVSTNQREYGPFGRKEGTSFSFAVTPDSDIVGFYGTATNYLNAIGVYTKPKYSPPPPVTGTEPIVSQELCEKMKAAMPRDTGAWGGCGGKHWDDGIFYEIKEVHVHVGKSTNLIHSVQFEYLKRDGTSVWSPKHGGAYEETTVEEINLDVEEFLVGVSGYFGPYEGCNGLQAIRCLTFFSNTKTYGPFGHETGTYFASPAFNGKVFGFHGRSSAYLNAIGVHMEYFS